MPPPKPRIDRRKMQYLARMDMRDGWRLRDYVSTVLNNGVGRYLCQLKRITFFPDLEGEGSHGLKLFIENDLLDFAHNNPGVATYVEPKRRKRPYMVGEYLNGREARMDVHDFNREQVFRLVNYMRNRSGRRITAFDLDWRTESPSIQGMWHPFLYQSTELNVTQFPSSKYSQFYSPVKTATDRARELFEQQKLEKESQERHRQYIEELDIIENDSPSDTIKE